MATLYKDSNNPNWFARFKNAEGKRVSRSTRTTLKRKAREIANDLEAAERQKQNKDGSLQSAFASVIEIASREAEAGELTLTRAKSLVERLHKMANPSFHVVSVKEHLSAWVESQAGHVSKSTMVSYWAMVRRFTTALGQSVSSKPLADLTKAEVEKARTKITKTRIKKTERTIKAATANCDLGALRRALTVAVEEGLTNTNVASSIKRLPENDSTERAPFTTEEVRKLIDHPDTTSEWAGAILMAAHTGLRLGDVVRVSSHHVEGTTLKVRPQKTKRKRKDLAIPLSPPCLQWIEDKEGDFFPTLKTTKTPTLSTQFVRIMKRANIPKTITDGDLTKDRTFHSLRHTFSSWLAEEDVHSDVRQKLTGHSSAGIHSRYTHHNESLNRAVLKLPQL
jgi:integrase